MQLYLNKEEGQEKWTRTDEQVGRGGRDRFELGKKGGRG